MINGSNEVHYTPVDGYGVATYADSGMISGGNSGDETLVNSTRFLWIYDPSSPYETPSGFTGEGWFSDISYSPIGYYLSQNSKTLKQFIDEFDTDKGGNRTNLNDVFDLWQKYITDNPGNTYVSQFAIQDIGNYTCVHMSLG